MLVSTEKAIVIILSITEAHKLFDYLNEGEFDETVLCELLDDLQVQLEKNL